MLINIFCLIGACILIWAIVGFGWWCFQSSGFGDEAWRRNW